MSNYVSRIATLRKDVFPIGKSLFVFPGDGDIIYFVMFKEGDDIRVVEVFDELLNRLPEGYNILKRVNLQDLLA
jgi:hypothetical protein